MINTNRLTTRSNSVEFGVWGLEFVLSHLYLMHRVAPPPDLHLLPVFTRLLPVVFISFFQASVLSTPVGKGAGLNVTIDIEVNPRLCVFFFFIYIYTCTPPGFIGVDLAPPHLPSLHFFFLFKWKLCPSSHAVTGSQCR